MTWAFAQLCALVFVSTFVLDFVWAKYTQAVTAHQALKASIFAIGTIVLSGTAAIGYTSDHWLLIPAAAGCFFGTYIAVIRAKKST